MVFQKIIRCYYEIIQNLQASLAYSVQPDGPRFKSQQEQQIFLIYKMTRPALRPTQPPIQ